MDEGIDLTWMSRGAVESVAVMVDEIYGNVLEHADPDGGYCVSLVDNGSRFEISVADAPVGLPRNGGHRGTGIARCRRLAAGLHGTVDVGGNGRQWTMSVTVPHPDVPVDQLLGRLHAPLRS